MISPLLLAPFPLPLTPTDDEAASSPAIIFRFRPAIPMVQVCSRCLDVDESVYLNIRKPVDQAREEMTYESLIIQYSGKGNKILVRT